MKSFKNAFVILALFTIVTTISPRAMNTSPGAIGSRPVASQPVRSQPVVSRPVVSRPVASRPVVSQPTAQPAYKDIIAIPGKPIASSFKLSTFSCISGSVLPIYTKDTQKFAILSREARGYAQADGGKKFTYDDFSGQCEAEDNYNPLLSAVREFHEEGNLEQSLGWTLEDAIKFVKENTLQVIVYTKQADPRIPKSREIKNVTYIVNFDKYADKLFNSFYPSLEKERARYKKLGITKSSEQVTTEKDKIAFVPWNDLREAITYQKFISSTEPVKVIASIRDEKKKGFRKEQVTLRDFLSIKLRSLFLNQPYEISPEDSRVRYYHQ